MQDLQQILESRQPYYTQAQLRLNTSRQTLSATLERLHQQVLDIHAGSVGKPAAHSTPAQEMTP
jgi:hypothetical protein